MTKDEKAIDLGWTSQNACPDWMRVNLSSFLEKDLHAIGCKTETIEVCGFKVVMIKIPEGVVSSD